MNQSATEQEKEKKQREKKLKELYTRYNKCRDLELDRFWKNSVFVWCFLLLCFTALGKIVFDYNTQYDLQLLHKGLKEEDYYLFALIISIIGLIFSHIWVWMARGLKAWYEVFEMAIWQMETKDNVFDFSPEYTINNFWIVKGTKNTLQKLFVSSAPISTSRIVIIIGKLLVLFWIIAFVYYDMRFSNTNCCISDCKQCNCHTICVCLYLFKLVLIPLLVITIISFCKTLVQSSTLETDGEKEIHHKIEKEIHRIINQRYDFSITEEDSYRFVCQNAYETIENKIKNCINMVSGKKGIKLTSEIQNNTYNQVINKIEGLNDYGIVNEVDAALASINETSVSINISIVRYLWYRQFNIDIVPSDNSESMLNLEADFNCLKDNVKSKYFNVTAVKKVNDNRIKVKCIAKHWFRDLLNIDIYNLHNEEKLNTNKL